MEIKRQSIHQAHSVLTSIFKQKMDTKTAYAVFVNLKLIEEEIRAFNDFAETQMPETYVAFDKERVQLCKEISGGAVNEQTGNFIIPEARQEEFNERLEKLKEEHKQGIEDRQKAQEHVSSLLQEKVEIGLKKFKIDRVPSISPMEIALLDEAGLLWED